jgi:hypothetical protein
VSVVSGLEGRRLISVSVIKAPLSGRNSYMVALNCSPGTALLHSDGSISLSSHHSSDSAVKVQRELVPSGSSLL